MDHLDAAAGTVTAVFGHRFVIEGTFGKTLIDLGPEAGHAVKVAEGDFVSVQGERKPTEIKATSITTADGNVHAVRHGKKPHEAEHENADPAMANDAATQPGYTIEGSPKRKPKHFDLKGRKDGMLFKLHVELNGTIRKAEAIEPEVGEQGPLTEATTPAIAV